jgi:hypothetical protein
MYGINVFSHYINIISLGQKLMCSIQYQSLLVLSSLHLSKHKCFSSPNLTLFNSEDGGDTFLRNA